jgi:uncharacterized membrane protein YhfC
MRTSGKAILAVIGAALVLLNTALDPLGVGGAGIVVDEWVAIANATLGAVGVYVVPNLTATSGAYAKTLISGIVAVLGSLSMWLIGGMTASDWVSLVLLFGTTVGVFFAQAPKHPVAPAVVRP